MTDTTTLIRPAAAASQDIVIVDCDVHPVVKSYAAEVYPFMEKRWADHIDTYGLVRPGGALGNPVYLRRQPDGNRRDALPPSGGPAGCDVAFMSTHHLDANKIGFGILNPITGGEDVRNPELAAAIASARNDWQLAYWTEKDARLRASILVPFENVTAAVAEIEKRAPDPSFVQVLTTSRPTDLMGKPRYWPIFEAAARAGLPLAVHAFGTSGHANTAGGWSSYYIEEAAGLAPAVQSHLTSLIIEGVFERFPTLKVVLVETGFAWLPALGWRLDRVWKRLRSETPHLKRLPSEYIADHIYITSQPMEEPEKPAHLLDTIDWIGWDRLLFATDYPHWDFDDPAFAMPLNVTKEQRRKFFGANALKLYGL